jgi:hypothetical protein
VIAALLASPALQAQDSAVSGSGASKTLGNGSLLAGPQILVSQEIDTAIVGFGGNPTDSRRLAQPFTGNGVVTYVSIKIGWLGTKPADNVTISIESDASGVPSGTVLGNATIPNADIKEAPDDSRWHRVELDSPVRVLTGETYHIVLERGGTGINFAWHVDPDGSTLLVDNGASGSADWVLAAFGDEGTYRIFSKSNVVSGTGFSQILGNGTLSSQDAQSDGSGFGLFTGNGALSAQSSQINATFRSVKTSTSLSRFGPFGFGRPYGAFNKTVIEVVGFGEARTRFGAFGFGRPHGTFTGKEVFLPLPEGNGALQAGLSSVTGTGNTSDRLTVFDDFWETAHLPAGASAWTFASESNTAGSANIARVDTTMDGNPALQMTFSAGILPSERFSLFLDLTHPDYGGSARDEVWFTTFVRFSSGFSTGGINEGGKIFGIGSGTLPDGAVTPGCGDGFSFRNAWVLDNGDGTIQGENFIHDPDKVSADGRQDRLANFNFTEDQVHKVEMHFKKNTAFDTFDGIMETKIDGVLVAQTTGLRTYCGSEANALSGSCDTIYLANIFWGGADSTWSPVVDSTITFGRVIVQVAPQATTLNETFTGDGLWRIGEANQIATLRAKTALSPHLSNGATKEQDLVTDELGITLPRIGFPGGDLGKQSFYIDNPSELGSAVPNPRGALSITITATLMSAFDPTGGCRMFGLQANDFDGDSNPDGINDGALVMFELTGNTGVGTFEGQLKIWRALGVDTVGPFNVTTDIEHQFTFEGILNSDGVSDGVARLKIDGVVVAEKTDVQFYTANRATHFFKGADFDVKTLSLHRAITVTQVPTAQDWITLFEATHQPIANVWTDAQIAGLSGAGPGRDQHLVEFNLVFFMDAMRSMYLMTSNHDFIDRWRQMMVWAFGRRDSDSFVTLTGADRYSVAPDWFKLNDSVPGPFWVDNLSGWSARLLRTGEASVYFAEFVEIVKDNVRFTQADRDHSDEVEAWLREILDGTGAAHDGFSTSFKVDSFGDGSVPGSWFNMQIGFGITGTFSNPVRYNQATGISEAGMIIDDIDGGGTQNGIRGEHHVNYLCGRGRVGLTGKAEGLSPITGNPFLRLNATHNSYEWDTAPKDEVISDPEDVGHAFQDVRACIRAFQSGRSLLDETDMVRFGNTYIGAADLSPTTFSRFVDGSGVVEGSHNSIAACIKTNSLEEWNTAALDKMITVVESQRPVPNDGRDFDVYAQFLLWANSTPNRQTKGSGPSLKIKSVVMEEI